MTTKKLNDCPMFDRCSAPLCPLDPEVAYRKWFPDEPICSSRKFGAGLLWIQNQRKIKKKCRATNTFFNLAMLNRNFIVKQGITGIDPDAKNITHNVDKWLKNHPALSSEQIERRRQSARQMLEKRGVSK